MQGKTLTPTTSPQCTPGTVFGLGAVSRVDSVSCVLQAMYACMHAIEMHANLLKHINFTTMHFLQLHRG